MSLNCYKLKRCGTPSSFMFVVLHLFYLVLDPGQVPDCEEFWLEGWGWERGVIGCRFWSSESNMQFYGFLQGYSCFKVCFCICKWLQSFCLQQRIRFSRRLEKTSKVAVKAQLLVLFRHNAPTGQHNAWIWFTENVSATYHLKMFWKHMSLFDHCSLLNRSFSWWKPPSFAFEEIHRCRNGSA